MQRAKLEKFFKYARQRHWIYLKRRDGLPKEQWTEDPIFRKFRFTNVFRELDKTTDWFRRNVRDDMRDDPDVLLATVVFRMFNRIAVGEAVFCQPDLGRNTAFAIFCNSGDVRPMRKVIRDFIPSGPYVTGAYIITSPPGYSKLDGILKILSDFYKDDWRSQAKYMAKKRTVTLQEAWLWLKTKKFFGKFHSYEIVTDLRWTKLLDRAPDVMTWCSVGPGARRGLNRVSGRDKRDHTRTTEQMLAEMGDLLQYSKSKDLWPKECGWPEWEMRDVEHTLCEFDKYERVRLGEGRPRGVFS